MDSEGPIGFIPILNSQRTRVTTATKNILIEITGTSEYAVNKSAEVLAASFIDFGAEVRKVRIRHGDSQRLSPEMEKRDMTIPTKEDGAGDRGGDRLQQRNIAGEQDGIRGGACSATA